MEKEKIRPPIVCVLGHVDHGKTTLLDSIRKTNVVAQEKGGITQSIGASVITTKEGKKITFIDTPGHAAFSKMRSRGAKVADIIVLVVAADDGVKPQTKEAIQLIKEESTSFVVAITKVDLPTASVEEVKGQLAKEGVMLEGRGGDIPVIAVSAKQGKGIDELLETISLLSEIQGVSASLDSPLEAVVIESYKDKKGPLATIVIRNGGLSIGDEIQAGEVNGKVKAIFDDKGVPQKKITAGYPALILGLEEVPSVGSLVTIKNSAPKLALKKKQERWIGKLKEGEIPIILKARNAGVIEAIKENLPSKIVVVDFSVGDVTESDVLAAKASNSLIFAFESRVSSQVAKLAQAEGVVIERFDIIYELIQRLEEILKKGTLQIQGKAEIIASFPFEDKKVAGCRVIEGKISKNDNLILMRGEKELGRVKAVSLKKQKQTISEATTGEEFGILFMPQLDFQIKDMLVSVRK